MGYTVQGLLNNNSGGGVATPIFGMAWDAFGRRISKGDTLSGGGTAVTTYVYDQAGHVIEENNNGAVTDYIYLDDQVVALYKPSGSHVVELNWDNRGQPFFARDVGENTKWNGFTYPQGSFYVTVGTSYTQDVRLPGQFYDGEEIGIFENGLRSYEFANGRYMQPDPIGLNGGLNPYLYANGNPLSFVDPSGLASKNWLTSYPIGPVQTAAAIKQAQDMQKAADFYNPANTFSIVTHAEGNILYINGNPYDTSDPIALNNVVSQITHANGYDTQQPVLLLACSAGVGGGNSIAQRLANALGNTVSAYTSDVGFQPTYDASGTVTGVVVQPVPSIDSVPISQPGHLQPFKPQGNN